MLIKKQHNFIIGSYTRVGAISTLKLFGVRVYTRVGEHFALFDRLVK